MVAGGGFAFEARVWYNRCMIEFNEMAGYAEKQLNKKIQAQAKKKTELESLEKEIARLENAREVRVKEMEPREQEIEALRALRDEVLILQERRGILLIKHRALLDEYETLPLDLDRFIGDWMSERGYDELLEERYAIEDRLKAIHKEIGSVFYRRNKEQSGQQEEKR